MAAPTVTALSPASGPAGTPVTITGTGFTEDTSAVKFGSVSAGTRFSVVSGTQMTAYAPAGTGTVAVKVTTPGGVGTVGSNWTYDPYVGPPAGGGGSAPTVTSVVPDTAVDNDGGDAVVVNGTGFTATTAVIFGAALAQFEVISDTALAVTTPGGSGVVDVTVVTAYGISENTAADNFTYPVGLIPTITSFTPESTGEMALVTITGTNFWTATGLVVVTGVTFTGAGATEIPSVFRAESATSLVVYVPEGAVTGPIKVYSEAGSATSASFTCLGTVYGVIQASADGKNRVFYDSGVPGATANLAGDVWFRYGEAEEANHVIAQYVGLGGTSWQSVTMSNQVIATLDVAKLTAGTINVAIELTSATITGGMIRTAAVPGAGNATKRIELDTDYLSRIRMFSGIGANETDPCAFGVDANGTTGAEIGMYGGLFSGNVGIPAYVNCHVGPNDNSVHIAAGSVSILINDSVGVITVDGNLIATGSVKPFTDWVSAGSDDGIWIQDRYASGLSGRWKLCFNSNTKGLSVSDGTDTYNVTLA